MKFLSFQPLGRSARPNSTFEPQLIAGDLTGVPKMTSTQINALLRGTPSNFTTQLHD